MRPWATPGEWNLAAVRGHPGFYQGWFPYSKDPLGAMLAPSSGGTGFPVFESSIICCGQENVRINCPIPAVFWGQLLGMRGRKFTGLEESYKRT